MRRPAIIFALALGAAIAVVAGGALRAPAQNAAPGKVSVTFPGPVIDYKNGPNLGIVQANCLVCHGADYTYNQPPLTRGQWTGEVNKMRNVFKATIADADVDKIVDYLMTQNGKT